MANSIVAMTAALAALVACAGDSVPFPLNTFDGTRVAQDVESIAYSTAWDNGTAVSVAVDGVTIKEAAAPASGDVAWNAAKVGDGLHTLTHTAYKNGVASKVETAIFLVSTPDPVTPDPVTPDPVTPAPVTHTVTFNAQGGVVAESSRVVTNGCVVGELPVATWNSRTFDGWFTAAVAGSQVSEGTVITADVTFYAHWTAVEAVEQTIAIPRAGWNLVSFNVMPDDPSPEAVFAAVADSIQSVVSGTRRWTPQSGGRLAALQIGVGYWVKTTRDNVVWTIRGKPDEGVEIRVNQGWNLIGYPLLEAGAPEVVLKGASEAGIISSVVSGTRRWTPQSGGRLAEMTPGVGYWLKAAKAGTIKFDK